MMNPLFLQFAGLLGVVLELWRDLLSDPLLLQIGALVVLLVFVSVAVQKASDDGFFSTCCTMVVLYGAYRVAYLQWDTTYDLLEHNLELDTASAVSASYWIGFFAVILPGMVWVRLLTRERVPFPKPVEKWGGMVSGALCGLLLFGVFLNWISRFGFYESDLQQPMRPYVVLLEFVVML